MVFRHRLLAGTKCCVGVRALPQEASWALTLFGLTWAPVVWACALRERALSHYILISVLSWHAFYTSVKGQEFLKHRV